jgi:hypothetical protein
MMLMMILLATEPPVTLFVACLLYVLSGPTLHLFSVLRQKKAINVESSTKKLPSE